jgi:predicted transcriptional regulator
MEDIAMKLDVDERADELALEIWNHLNRKTADLRPGYTEEFIRRMWFIAVTKVLAEIEELIRRYDSADSRLKCNITFRSIVA